MRSRRGFIPRFGALCLLDDTFARVFPRRQRACRHARPKKSPDTVPSGCSGTSSSSDGAVGIGTEAKTSSRGLAFSRGRQSFHWCAYLRLMRFALLMSTLVQKSCRSSSCGRFRFIRPASFRSRRATHTADEPFLLALRRYPVSLRTRSEA